MKTNAVLALFALIVCGFLFYFNHRFIQLRTLDLRAPDGPEAPIFWQNTNPDLEPNIQLIQNTYVDGGGKASLPNAVRGNDLLVATCIAQDDSWFNNALIQYLRDNTRNPITISDSQGNKWKYYRPIRNGNMVSQFFYIESTNRGIYQVQCTASGKIYGIAIAEYSSRYLIPRKRRMLP